MTEFAGSDVVGGTNFAPFGPSGASFGISVALRHGTLLVGASGQHPQPGNVPNLEGEAYVYRINQLM